MRNLLLRIAYVLEPPVLTSSANRAVGTETNNQCTVVN